jgi:hypothetical protein
MRIPPLLVAFALTFATASALAQSRPYDPKALARYDTSYVTCEARFPDMAGHKDEAYLGLWRIKLDPKSTARLAEIRGSAAYKAERQVAAKGAAKPAASAASSVLERQCRGLWGEFQRAPRAKP